MPPVVPIVPAANNGFILYIAGDIFTIEPNGGTVPASGTVWALRQYVGAITGGNGAGGSEGPYAFSQPDGVRPLTAVGTDLRVSFQSNNTVAHASVTDLKKVHTVPDPLLRDERIRADHGHQVHQVREPASQGHYPDLPRRAESW